jgi:hypothetical protein
MPSFSVAIASADALTAANRLLAAALGGEDEEKLIRPVLMVRSWTGVNTIGLAISLSKAICNSVWAFAGSETNLCGSDTQ